MSSRPKSPYLIRRLHTCTTTAYSGGCTGRERCSRQRGTSVTLTTTTTTTLQGRSRRGIFKRMLQQPKKRQQGSSRGLLEGPARPPTCLQKYISGVVIRIGGKNCPSKPEPIHSRPVVDGGPPDPSTQRDLPKQGVRGTHIRTPSLPPP